MSTEALITVKDLHKHFDALHALDGVSTGSGKSTFLRSLNLLEEPTSGEIIFEGVHITDPKVDINKHRQKMGMVFQQFNLFPHMTILKNMTIAPVKLHGLSKEAAEKKAMELLERVGLADRAPPSSRAVRNSASPSCVPSVWNPTSCSSTNPPPLWTPRW